MLLESCCTYIIIQWSYNDNYILIKYTQVPGEKEEIILLPIYQSNSYLTKVIDVTMNSERIDINKSLH